MTRKIVSVQNHPELNSLLRLGHQMNNVKTDLANADKKALDLAKTKIVDSPNTNKTFKKTVSKKVDFASKEKLFNQLTSLDLSYDPHEKHPKKVPSSVSGKRDPEPKLSDFHQPFHGEPVPLMDDDKDIRDSIINSLNSPESFINSIKIQDNFQL